MNAWLRFLLGLEEGEIPAGGESRWELTGLPHGPWLLAAAAVALAVAALIVAVYRCEAALTWPRRSVLAGLRLLALALVVLMLLDPRVLTELRLRHPSRVLVLFDTSASMAESDEPEAETRALLEAATGLDPADRPARLELAAAAFRRRRILEKLQERHRVQLFAFAEKLEPLASLDALSTVQPGEATGLGDALRAARAAAGTGPLASLVVVSDGRSNAGAPPAEVAREIAAGGVVPVHAVGVGRVRIPANLSVRELEAPQVAEVDFPLQVEARVEIQGVRADIVAALYRERRGQRGKVLVAERHLQGTGHLVEAELKFIDRLPEKGEYRYTLELPSVPGETEVRDNRREARVTAAAVKRRLLLLAGAATREYRFLRNFVLRDDGIVASCWLSYADPELPQDGDIVLRRQPETAEELREYDAVALLDPAPESLTAALQEGLREFVAELGGGLVYVAGEAHTAVLARDVRFDLMRRLLPVDLARAGTLRFDAVYEQPWRPELAAAHAAHPLARLLAALGEEHPLPALYFAYPARHLRPAAVTLANAPAGEVVCALQQVGQGQCLYLGSDDLWRLREAGEARHEAFWSGAIRFVAAGRSRQGERHISVETDRNRYRLGERVLLTAQVLDASRRPVELPRLELELVEAAAAGAAGSSALAGAPAAEGAGGGGETVFLAPVPGRAGEYTGRVEVDRPGTFELRADSQVRARFQVERVSSELEDLRPDLEALAALAAHTGGELVTLDRIDRLPAAIPDRSVTEVIGRRAATVWDSAVMMGLLSGLLIVEWVLRKLWSLN